MRAFLLAAAFSVLAAPSFTATVNVSGFTKSSYEGALSPGSVIQQNFEGYDEGNVAQVFSTNVGTFSALGGVGSGGTVKNAGFNNDGSLLALRDGDVFGRTSTTKTLSGSAADDMFLDSNDTFGIVWDVMLAGQKMFDRLVFTVTDAAEFGNSLRIAVNGHAPTNVDSSGNGKKRLVVIDFGQNVSNATITLSHFKGSSLRKNDGFSLDDIAVSTVPLPASALFLLGGLGGLAALRRRKG